MLKLSITKANLEKFVVSCIANVFADLPSELVALASVAAETVVNENGGAAGVEPIACEWARHPELKAVAAAIRTKEGFTPTLALETIGKLAAARAMPEAPRLALIQKLSAWTPESAENLEKLIAEANVPELALTFDQVWHRAMDYFPSYPRTYEELQELAKRIWNLTIDVSLATAQPVADELLDCIDELRYSYAKQMGDKADAAVLERFSAAWKKLDVLSIPYAALEPVIRVMSQTTGTGGVTCTVSEKLLRVVRQRDAGYYVAVIEGNQKVA